MKLHSLLFLGLIAPLAFAATDQEAIRSARLRQNDALARHAFDEVVKFWTDDVTICRGLGAQLAGKAAYRKLVEENRSGPNAIAYQRLPDAIEASSLWPLAFETGRWEGHLGGIDGPVVISGRYSAQWVKRAGQWLIRSEVFVALEGAGVGRDFPATP